MKPRNVMPESENVFISKMASKMNSVFYLDYRNLMPPVEERPKPKSCKFQSLSDRFLSYEGDVDFNSGQDDDTSLLSSEKVEIKDLVIKIAVKQNNRLTWDIPKNREEVEPLQTTTNKKTFQLEKKNFPSKKDESIPSQAKPLDRNVRLTEVENETRKMKEKLKQTRTLRRNLLLPQESTTWADFVQVDSASVEAETKVSEDATTSDSFTKQTTFESFGSTQSETHAWKNTETAASKTSTTTNYRSSEEQVGKYLNKRDPRLMHTNKTELTVPVEHASSRPSLVKKDVSKQSIGHPSSKDDVQKSDSSNNIQKGKLVTNEKSVLKVEPVQAKCGTVNPKKKKLSGGECNTGGSSPQSKAKKVAANLSADIMTRKQGKLKADFLVDLIKGMDASRNIDKVNRNVIDMDIESDDSICEITVPSETQNDGADFSVAKDTYLGESAKAQNTDPVPASLDLSIPGFDNLPDNENGMASPVDRRSEASRQKYKEVCGGRQQSEPQNMRPWAPVPQPPIIGPQVCLPPFTHNVCEYNQWQSSDWPPVYLNLQPQPPWFHCQAENRYFGRSLDCYGLNDEARFSNNSSSGSSQSSDEALNLKPPPAPYRIDTTIGCHGQTSDALSHLSQFGRGDRERLSEVVPPLLPPPVPPLLPPPPPPLPLPLPPPPQPPLPVPPPSLPSTLPEEASSNVKTLPESLPSSSAAPVSKIGQTPQIQEELPPLPTEEPKEKLPSQKALHADCKPSVAETSKSVTSTEKEGSYAPQLWSPVMMTPDSDQEPAKLETYSLCIVDIPPPVIADHILTGVTTKRPEVSSISKTLPGSSATSQKKQTADQKLQPIPSKEANATKENRPTKPETRGKFHGRTLLMGKAVPPRYVPMEPLYIKKPFTSRGTREIIPIDPRIEFYRKRQKRKEEEEALYVDSLL